MTKYVIDSFAWLEYFMGTQRGFAAMKIIDSNEEVKFTPSICLAEIYAKSLKTEGEKMAETRRNFIHGKSAIPHLNEQRAIGAAKIDVERKKLLRRWGLADSIVLATARELNAKVVTGDHHFSGLEEAIII